MLLGSDRSDFRSTALKEKQMTNESSRMTNLSSLIVQRPRRTKVAPDESEDLSLEICRILWERRGD